MSFEQDNPRVEHRGETYYVGEESVFDADRQEIGYACSRGNQSVIVAVDSDRNEIAKAVVTVSPTAVIFDTVEDLIDMVNLLRNHNQRK